MIFCVTQNQKTSVFRWVFSTNPGALCWISSSVAGLIPGERTSATPRSALQISDRHLGRYPIHNAPLAIRYPPDIRPRPLPGLIFSNIRPRFVTNWISTCGLNRFATCSLRSAECHRVKPTAHLVCVISEVTGAQLVTAAQHTLRRVGSL